MVQRLQLVDYDEVCISNFNRQLHGLKENIGITKVEALKKRFEQINPSIEIMAIEDFYSPDNSDEILSNSDIVVDAIDTFSAKCHLIRTCKEKAIPLVVAGSAGGKTDPTQIHICDLARTKNDPLLQNIRKRLRRDYAFPRNKRKFKISAVYSEELPQWFATCEKPKGSLDCESGYGTATYITGSFGFFCAYEALRLATSES